MIIAHVLVVHHEHPPSRVIAEVFDVSIDEARLEKSSKAALDVTRR